MTYPQNGQDLLTIFGNIADSGYVEAVFLNDTKVGFSIQKEYLANIRFMPAKTSQGKNDNIACIWVVYESEQEKDNNRLIPIRFRIANMSRYRSKHWFDDDNNDPDKPTQESLLASRDSPQPMELTLRDGYFYDASINKLVDDSGKSVNGVQPLNEIYDAHCKSVHPIFSLGMRSKQAVHNFSQNLIGKLIDWIKLALKHIFGRTLNDSRDRSSYFDGYTYKEFGKLAEDCIELFGYKVAKRVLGIFFLIAIFSSYWVYPFKKDSYSDFAFHSDVLLTIFCLSGLLILEIVLPNLIFVIMNLLIYARKIYINWLLKRR